MSKSALKDAREAIKKKDYKGALRLCKSVLREDKGNYMALVLLGVTFQEGGPKNQAPLAFRKATLSDPNQPLAWQGLASYYEKESGAEAWKELITAYSHLITIENDMNKYTEFCNKLMNAAIQLQDFDHAITILQTHALKSDVPEDKRNVAWVTIATLLTHLTPMPVHLNPVYEHALSEVVKNSTTVTIDYYKRYLKHLYKMKKLELLISESIVMHSLFNSEIYPLEWICKVFVETNVEKNPIILKDDIEKYIESLIQLNPESSMGLLAHSVIIFNRKNYLECRDLLTQVFALRGSLMHAWTLLAECNSKLYCFVEAEQAARCAVNLLTPLSTPNTTLLLLAQTLLCEALTQQSVAEKAEEAVRVCQSVLETVGNNSIVACIAKALTHLGRYDDAERYVKILRNDAQFAAHVCLIEAQQLQRKGALDAAVRSLAAYDKRDNVEVLLECGKLQWQLGKFKESLVSFLETAKIDPNCYLSFVHLGQYYQQIKDVEKARRCYQKAFKINPKCAAAGIGLSNIYREQKNWDANKKLLESVTMSGVDSRCKWAWLQLGVHYLDQGNYNAAVDSLRSVIRADPFDSHGWETLADAYLARGAYTASMKSYERALELLPSALYPALQIGSIKQTLGQFVEAIQSYKAILNDSPNYVPALKGLGETHVALAKIKYENQLLGTARANAQEAVNVITLGLNQRKDLSCLWKLLADSCAFVAMFPKKYCFLYIAAALTSTEAAYGLVLLDQQDLFNLATRAYCRSLGLVTDNVLIWHDIASNYYNQSRFASRSVIRTLHERSLAALKHCVTINQLHWQHWNLLGVVAVDMRDLRLAQHSFIKAISLSKNNAMVWTNLGSLYLMLGDLKLANKAFTFAQRCDPNYVQSWIGQALIAESLGHEDAMDLFRHSAQLGPEHVQGGLGYAHWVCSTLTSAGGKANDLYSIKNMHAIPVATDALDWYTDKVDNNACALNMLGLLKERQKLYRSSAEAFKKALKSVDTDHRDIVLTNLARVLVVLEDYAHAIECYKQVKEASFYSGCGLALACFKAEQYEESYSTYETALNWLAPDDNKKSHILVAMSTMAYMFQGPDDAKTLLFQCIELQPPSMAGMFAACALGLLHGDLKLANLVLKEVAMYCDDPEYLHHIAALKAHNHLMQNESLVARNSLSRVIHKHPAEPQLWLSLARLLLRQTKTPDAAARCALVAIQQGRSNIDVSKIMCLVSLAEVLSGNFKRALRIAQQAVHSHPDTAEGWMLLVSALLPQCEETRDWQRTEWLRYVVSHIRRNTTTTRSMTQWLSNHERKVAMLVTEYKV